MHILLCTPLKILQKAKLLWLCFCLCLLQNVVYLCLASASFLSRVGSQIVSAHAGCLKCKQSLSGCKCRFQIWDSFKSRYHQTVPKKKKIYDLGNTSELGIKTCCVNPAVNTCPVSSALKTKCPWWILKMFTFCLTLDDLLTECNGS